MTCTVQHKLNVLFERVVNIQIKELSEHGRPNWKLYTQFVKYRPKEAL